RPSSRRHPTSFSSLTPAPAESYPLSLHDALPISVRRRDRVLARRTLLGECRRHVEFPGRTGRLGAAGPPALRGLAVRRLDRPGLDRKSTRLNSRHVGISYADFCLKKKRDDTSTAS